jgi:peroxiredoxin Q/BCP
MNWLDLINTVGRPVDQWMSGRREGKMLKVGDDAPEFRVQDHNGEWVSMSDFLGKKVLLWFYPKADTPGCTAEGCGLRDRHDKYTAKNVAIVGVSFDNVKDNQKFVEKYGFPYQLLCDTKREIGLAYGACRTENDEYASRIGYLIDEKGVVAKAYPKVDAKSFPETALADL